MCKLLIRLNFNVMPSNAITNLQTLRLLPRCSLQHEKRINAHYDQINYFHEFKKSIPPKKTIIKRMLNLYVVVPIHRDLI